EIEHMRATAEGVDAWLRAGVRPLEAPPTGQTESLRTTLDEKDHLLGIAGHLVADPQGRAVVLRLDRQQEPVGGHVFARGVLGEALVEGERARCVVVRADIEHAREVHEEISHVWSPEMDKPGAWPGSGLL